MLTVEAESYRDEALEIGREEAARRRLDLPRVSSTMQWGSHEAPPSRKPASLRFTQPFPAESLAGFRFAVFLCVLSLVLEILAWNIPGPSEDVRRYTLLGVLLLGTMEYLRIVAKLHGALQLATEGGYPVTAPFSVVAHFIPFYNVYWLYDWPARVSDCAATNGRNWRFDRLVPALLFGLGVWAGFYYVTPRIVSFLAATWYTQHALLRALRHPREAAPIDTGHLSWRRLGGRFTPEPPP